MWSSFVSDTVELTTILVILSLCAHVLSIPICTFVGENFTAVYLEDVPIGSIPLGKGLQDAPWFLCYHCVVQHAHCSHDHMVQLPSCCHVDLTGHDMSPFLLINFEYGPNYSGPGWAAGTALHVVCTKYHICISLLIANPFRKDTLAEGRAIGEAENADESNFLHPVIYYYKYIHHLSESHSGGLLLNNILPRILSVPSFKFPHVESFWL